MKTNTNETTSLNESVHTRRGLSRRCRMRTACLLLALCTLCSLMGVLTGCAVPDKAAVYPVHIEGSIFGGKSDDSIAYDLRFDPAWITGNNNTRYQPDLAAFSAVLCADVYFREKDMARGTQNRVLPDAVPAESYSPASLLGTLGFEDVRYIESFKVKEYAGDTNDSITMTLAYMKVGSKYDAFVAVIRGCFSAQEWASAFDPGCAGDAYTALTGEHPDWTDSEVCKGFSVAAARASAFIEDYVAGHDDPDRQNCLLITGHSRGGSVANLIGAKLETREDVKSFTYTFNAPAVIDRDSAASCKTVFNIFDSRDFFTNPFPFGQEPLARNGRDMALCIADSEDVKAAIAAVKGRSDYTSIAADVMAAYAEQFGKRFPNRASLYNTYTLTETFADADEADARLAAVKELIAGLDVGALCQPGTVSAAADGGYTVTMTVCDAALIAGYARLLAYGQSAHEAYINLFAADREACAIADLLAENLPELSGGHLLVNSLALAGKVK